MTLVQAITPDPDIDCRPGWCLEYVRRTFGLPAHFNSATEAWENATSPHPDANFPEGVWVPIWFSLEGIPEGHVALRAPDGSIYSTSDEATVPHHHPSLDDLLAYYWRRPLTLRGWSEDVAGTPVVKDDGSISTEGNITQGDTSMDLTPQNIADIALGVWAFKNPNLEPDRDTYEILRSTPANTWKQKIDHRAADGTLEPAGTTPETVLSFVDYNTNQDRQALAAAARAIVDSVKAAPSADAGQAAEAAYEAFLAKLQTINLTISTGK